MKTKTKLQSAFRKSIRCGTGKAYLMMTKHPEMNFSNEIYKASIKNYAYDGQSEGDRTIYLLQFYHKLPPKQIEKLKKKLIKQLFEEKEDTWSLLQLFNLCGFFAQTDKTVKKSIYKRFRQTPIEDSDWLGTDALLELDGTDGMIAIAEHFGKRLLKNKHDWQDGAILNRFDENHPEQNIKARLKQEAKSNPYIDAYLRSIASTTKRREKYTTKRTSWTCKKIAEHLTNDAKIGLGFGVIEKLSKHEIKKVAKMLKDKPSEQTIRKLLYVFTLVQFPYSINQIKKYTHKKYSSLIRNYAFKALSLFEDEATRELALKQLNKTNTPAKYLNILKSNYKEGDSKIITKTIHRFKDEHIIEEIAISLNEVYKLNSTKDCKKPLVALYHKMNCALHRNALLKILYKNGVLDEEILSEMEFDSNEQTRKLHKKILKKGVWKG